MQGEVNHAEFLLRRRLVRQSLWRIIADKRVKIERHTADCLISHGRTRKHTDD